MLPLTLCIQTLVYLLQSIAMKPIITGIYPGLKLVYLTRIHVYLVKFVSYPSKAIRTLPYIMNSITLLPMNA